MRNLDPHSIPLESTNLIEASAGTGKSWTVTLLYLRIILEKGLTVDQILVVTFTEAATKELRDDIRKRLVEALAAFEDASYQKDDEYSRLIDKYIDKSSDKEEAIRRLNQAKLSLDEAAIFTIHGFCQRALTEYAFQAALPFESELMDDDYQLMQKLSDDFWRKNFQKAPPALLFKLQQKSITPDSLLKDIRDAVGKPYLTLCPPQTKVDDSQWQTLETVFQIAIKHWWEHSDEIKCLLCNPAIEEEYNKTFVKCREAVLAEMDCLANLDKVPMKIDSKLSWLGKRDNTTAKFDTLEHPFFQDWQAFLDLWNVLDKSADDFINQIRIDLLDYLQTELPKEKCRLGVLSFDDLLLNLQQALQKNEGLGADLRHKYQAALIDEFQDTDPIQYDIFNTIYKDASDNAVFLVGDPKQAIYSFRGGDIHTYLTAKSNTSSDNHYTLKTNWRSHPDLICAFNALFSPADNPFQNDNIKYIEVDAGNLIKDKLSTPDNRKPLCFWQYDTDEEKPPVATIRKEIANAVAADIAELLNASIAGKASIGDKQISGGDIAILVRGHDQGNLIKDALNKRGVASVQSGKNNIFETNEANQLWYLLTAIVEPQREDNVRRALVTELMGLKADDLLVFESDASVWEAQLQAMQEWHYLWKKQGFLVMMRNLMRSQKLHQHLLSCDNGERRLTNLLHLSELIHHQSREQSLSMEEVLRWLKQQQQTSHSKKGELRLESDEKLVKIVTIHASKGLEYPIVYCPFVGMDDEKSISGVFGFNQEDTAFLEIGSPDFKEHKEIKAADQRAENMRLFYVALTRAKYQCTLVSFNRVLSGSNKSALSRLLTGGQKFTNVTKSTSKKALAENEVYYSVYNGTIESLARTEYISAKVLPEVDESLRYNSAQTEQSLDARKFSAKIKSQAQITSFSGLTAGSHTESPDYDHQSDMAVLLSEVETVLLSGVEAPPPFISELTVSSFETDNSVISVKPFSISEEFPRGATAGSALHEIYENLDFTQVINEQEGVILSALSKWGFDKKHQATVELLMEKSLQTELFKGFSLQDLNNQKRLNEMEFYLPLERLQITDLQQILFKHLPQDWQLVREAVSTLNFEQVEGYLKGFIDLIFEHEGKYYVVDYKSNSLSDYKPENLLSVMADSHYYLQYLLYSVALHRYLQKRITDYSWEAHIGGAYYLFIRGMLPLEPAQGVFYHKPDQALIEALDALFGEVQQ